MKKEVVVLILAMVALAACGKVGVDDSTQKVVASGTATIEVRSQFLDQLHELCEDALIINPYPDAAAFNSAVAQCVLANADLINVGVNLGQVK